jgi:filamentous hemagglutinin family protein
MLYALGQAQAQPITAELNAEGNPVTDTNVTTNANQINITGGTQAGANLFHSFEKFGLDSGQIANFVSHPNIQNILGRVVGGNPSVINGLIQVTVQGGVGNPNLFLMNPAGMIFGPNASLNVPASFTATTATGIGFGNGWFNAVGDNNYPALVGNPNTFAFTTAVPGSIINAGSLSVQPGNNITLLGGTVVNTGQLNAPGGEITVAAVPGESLVRITQQGMLLSLEVKPLASADNQPENWALPVPSLPELLTGGGAGNATGLKVNEDGQVILTGSGISINAQTGATTVSGTLNASNPALGQTGGTVQVLGNKVVLADQAQVNVSGDAGGGTALIGGDYQGKGQVPNATQTSVESGVTINANALTEGDGGRVIVWSDDTTNFHGNISARGGDNSGNGGFVEVSGKEHLTFAGAVDTFAPKGNMGTLMLDPATLNITNTQTGGEIGTDTVSWGLINSLGKNANVVLNATGQITIEDITGEDITSGIFGNNNLVTLDLTTGRKLTIQSRSGNVIFADRNDTIETRGGSIEISGRNIRVGNFTTNIGASTGGSLNIFGTSIVAGKLTGGSINLSSTGNIRARQISGSSVVMTATAGGIIVGNKNENDYNDPTKVISASNDSTGVISDSNSIELSARDSIDVVGRISGNSVTLSSTSGDVIVGTIKAGAGGVNITAANLFQARGAYESGFIDGYIRPRNNRELRRFLEAKRIPFDPNEPVYISFGYNAPEIPISIFAETNSSAPTGSINAPVTIRYGGASRTLVNQRFPTINNPSASSPPFSRILIRGGAGAFSSGPTATGTGKLVPDTDDKFVTWDNVNRNFVPINSSTFTLNDTAPNDPRFSTLYRNETYTSVFPSDTFPANTSGTAGAIIVGVSNTGFYGSTQSVAFGPSVQPRPIDRDPRIVDRTPRIVDPGPRIVDPGPRIVDPDPRIVDPDPRIVDPDPRIVDRDPTYNSTALHVFDYTGAVLDVSLVNAPDGCHATGLLVNSDRTLELTGSCLKRENEESNELSEHTDSEAPVAVCETDFNSHQCNPRDRSVENPQLSAIKDSN